MTAPVSPTPARRPHAVPITSITRRETTGRSVPAPAEDVSTLLWEPFADWEYRPDPDGYVEDLGAPELWTWERTTED